MKFPYDAESKNRRKVTDRGTKNQRLVMPPTLPMPFPVETIDPAPVRRGIGVLGDLILDRYLWGTASRLSLRNSRFRWSIS